MKCLVKIYDTEQINNLISILSFRPRKVIFLYDNRCTKVENLSDIESACVECVEDISFEFVSIDTQSLDDIKSKCKRIIRYNKECVFDITGGEELTPIGVYLSCINGFIPVFKLDIDLKKLVNVYGCSEISDEFVVPDLNLETIMLSKGAQLSSCLHPTPEDTQFEFLLSFCQVVFSNINSWKELCSYVQNGTKSLDPEHKSLNFNYPRNSKEPKLKLSDESGQLLVHAQKFKLIRNLELSENSVKFIFNNANIKRYLTDFGSWLELYCYITLKESGLFKDVKMSVRIEWNAEKDRRNEVVNEVDITFFSGITPVFVSCKLSDPTAEALQELSIYPSYFGGKRSKCILVTTGNVRVDKPRVVLRAKEMGIHIIDKRDIGSGRFLEKMRQILGLDKKAEKGKNSQEPSHKNSSGRQTNIGCGT